MPPKDLVGAIGSILLISSGVWILMHDAAVTCMLRGDFACPYLLAAVQPEAVQPWVSLVNTAMITIGTTLIMLRQRWLRVDAEEKAGAVQEQVDRTRREVDARQERDSAERRVIQDQVCEIQRRLDGAYHLLGLYRAAIAIDREWITRVATKHGEPLPHDFGEREFDPVPNHTLDRHPTEGATAANRDGPDTPAHDGPPEPQDHPSHEQTPPPRSPTPLSAPTEVPEMRRPGNRRPPGAERTETPL